MWNSARCLIVAVAVLSAGSTAAGQGMDKVVAAPTEKPIERVVPWGTGGGSDPMARALDHDATQFNIRDIRPWREAPCVR